MMRGFSFSAALHLAVFLLFALGPSPKAFEWDRADAIAVDLVAPQRPPVPDPVALPEPEPEPEPEIVEPDPVPEKVEAAPEKVEEAPAPVPAKKVVKRPPPRRFERIAPKQEDPGPTLAERLEDRLAKAPDPETAVETESEPNRPAPAASSTEVEASDFPYAWYLNVVKTKVTDSWDPPGEHLVARDANQVVVRMRIFRDGRVSNVRVDGGSRTPGLDASAMRAVDRARPFPPLPENYEGEYLDVGIRFTVADAKR